MSAELEHLESTSVEPPAPSRSRWADLFFTSLFFALLFIPLFGTLLGQSEKGGNAKLGGVEEKNRFSQFSFQKFLDGSLQSEFEKWFSSHLGFRSVLIRSHNQMDFSVFRSLAGKRAILGKDHYLYQSQYIEDYNGLLPMDELQMDAFVERLRLLKGGLESRGVKFLFFLTPSKASLLPEFLPEKYRFAPEVDTTERFLRKLQSAGIPVLDGVKLAQEMKVSSPYPVFPPGAAHWSSYVSCQAAARFTELLGGLLGKETPILSCDPPRERQTPIGVDKDLAELTNIWTSSSFDVPLLYPTISIKPTSNPYLAKILFIGDSFMWSFLHNLEKRPVYETRDFYYYYNSQQRYRRGQRPSKRTILDRSKVDWNYIFSRDLVVLEVNQIRIREGGYGFVEDLLKALENR